MAKTKPQKTDKKSKQNGAQPDDVKMAPALFEQATELLQEGQPDEALPIAQKLIKILGDANLDVTLKLPALDLLGEIYVELGAADDARNTFLEAVKLDPDGSLGNEVSGGADKFLWLAQLSEEGGEESVKWFEQGTAVLRRELSVYDGKTLTEQDEVIQEIKQGKLANALCGAAEVYMTDLSWNDDAEQRAEALVTEACMVAPDSPEPLQTLASVRLSQEKLEDARAALTRSMDIWIDLPPEDPSVPDFPTQISLVRLLMDAGMEDQAMEVLERLVDEDDHSVEAWYLGGWCLNVMAEKDSADGTTKPAEESAGSDVKTRTLKTSRDWLLKCLNLYGKLEYEDERLKAHADELVEEMNKVLGPPVEGADNEEDDEWEGIEEDSDEDAQEDEVMEGT